MRFAKRAGVVVGTVLCTACTSLPDWSVFDPFKAHGPVSGVSYSFSWRLSGNRAAGPQQVFDDGRSTWLQFDARHPIPAIFARTAQGDQLLSYRRHGEYVVLDGVWPVLVLRAAGLQSRVERIEGAGPAPRRREMSGVDVESVDAETAASGSADVGIADVGTVDVGTVDVGAARLETAGVGATSVPTAGAESTHTTLSVPEAWPVAQVSWPSFTYRVSPQDGNIRLALSRWAATSGWTFEPEHWAVDVDIPIAGTAAFELEFDQAVQQLLASTELSDRPLQPCFYANKVLRVVPYAQSCDRSMPRERV
ncbi:MAG TPA: TcpQ domain-containing protein [Pusillimonas sp.]|uniref:TcpQ domain-containing protein n=1 Tax=Pusillimonas sp. TaxID=3040095 RepID=UPI002CEA6166|nr:TcpQ domain-containing protein [Pusillimonas sp.]HUH86633.1 TcpQ domain-containing protein [Pusillimonas sp.]